MQQPETIENLVAWKYNQARWTQWVVSLSSKNIQNWLKKDTTMGTHRQIIPSATTVVEIATEMSAHKFKTR